METETKLAQHFIAGAWSGEPRIERLNPARPGEVVALSAAGGGAELDAAVAAAEAAQPAWGRTPLPARGAILEATAALLLERQAEIAVDLVREEGKTLAEAGGEVARAASFLRYYGGEGTRLGGETFPAGTERTLIYSRREPVGVAGLITPWNFPLAIPTWKTAPALITGNSVVLKPAELTPLCANHLASALADAGLPPGVFNVVHGVGPEVGSALVDDERVGAVSFTGSTAVGRRINERAAARMARVQLEMGGKNAIVVLPDADAAETASIVARSAFALTGQACTAASRLIVPPSRADEVVEAVCAEAARYAPRDGLAEGSLMGPLVSGPQLESVAASVERAVAAGAGLASGGRGEGQFFAPTVLRGVSGEDEIAQEEVFGPVLAVIEADGTEAAIAALQGVRYGLTASICTRDLGAAHSFAAAAEVGIVKVNLPTIGLESHVPFGGVKDSSTGTFREHGRAGMEFFTWSKSVYVSY